MMAVGKDLRPLVVLCTRPISSQRENEVQKRTGE